MALIPGDEWIPVLNHATAGQSGIKNTMKNFLTCYLRLITLRLNYLLTPLVTNGMKMGTTRLKIHMLELKQELDRAKRTGLQRKRH
jgi:hypothetical protein